MPLTAAMCESSQHRPQVLVVDDEAGMSAALEVSFARRGWQVASASGKSEALARLRVRPPELVVSDIRMPDGDGFEVMRAARQTKPGTPVILMTGFGSISSAVDAIKAGACEYLVKPVPLDHLLQTAERLCASDHGLVSSESRMVGSAPALLRSLDEARRAAKSGADVLIEAESGTGKELLARMIHQLSSRREGPFVAINCAGFPESLLESELFGHARGAFTGADGAQPGKFQLAHGGTLLLDEIGEMPLGLQPKLLRALQEREFYRLGDAHPVKVDIRVIATTNRNLATMVGESRFRADLYFRLNVIPLTLPPLRERREDVRALALHFARSFSPETAAFELSEALLEKFESYSWPGNVRELANVVRRTVALGREHFEMTLPHHSALAPLAPEFSLRPSTGVRSSSLLDPGSTWGSMRAGISLETMERRLIEMTLDATAGNRSRAAEMLGVSLRTVRNKIREYNLPARRHYAQGND